MAVSIISGSKITLTKEHLANSCFDDIIQKCSKLIFVGIDESGLISPQCDCEDKTVEKKFIQIKSSNIIDAVFKLKRELDIAQIFGLTVYVPEEHLNECTKVKNLLFPRVCKTEVLAFPIPGVVGGWKHSVNEISNFEFEVKEYLKGVPSDEEVKHISSNIIPKDLFRHGYATRFGGCSTWPTMASLNLSYSLRKPDSLLVVKENARRLCQSLNCDPEKYHLAKANHGKDIWVYEKQPPEAYDGIVTQTPGVLVASPAADCNMLILADPITKSCGAIHAGWKGILLGIVQSSVNAMVQNYNSDPKNIVASLGPSLSVCCCEFGAEDSKKFLQIAESVVIWKTGREKPHLDLRLAVRVLLEKCGLRSENIDDGVHGFNPTPSLATCTKCDPTKSFFSYRRDGAMFGNCVGFICLKK